MGQCVACRSRVSPVQANAILNNELEDIRKKIIDTIYSLHKVYLDCSVGIDNCRVDNNMQLAIFLRSKYTYLKSQEKAFQDLMKRVDEAVEIEKSSKKKENIEECKKAFSAMNEAISRDDVSKILENQSEYLQELEHELKTLNLNSAEIQSSIEKEFRERASGDANVVRKRYIRRGPTI